MTFKMILVWMFRLILLGLIVVLIFGFMGVIHPAFDSFSHFRIHILVLLLLFLLITSLVKKGSSRYIYIVLLLITTLYTYTLFQPAISIKHNGSMISLNFVQFNLNFRNQHMPKVQKFMEKNSIDIMTFQEVTTKHRLVLEQMRDHYPYQAHCKFEGVGDVAILSKYPFAKEEGTCLEREGLVWSKIIINDQPINIVSIHLHWPFPYRQHTQIDTLSSTLQKIPSPKIIAGDFNAASWSHTMQRISKLSHTTITPGLRWSLNMGVPTSLFSMQLPIDHILISEDIIVESINTGISLGSDHLPIVSKIAFLKTSQLSAIKSLQEKR